MLHCLARNPEDVYGLPPRLFEKLVALILERLGYAVTLTPASRDGGWDLYAERLTDLGRLEYLVECKRWSPSRPVGIDVVQRLYGVVSGSKATGGVVVTTSRFTAPAKAFQQTVHNRLALRDSMDLRAWLAEYRDA